MSLAIVRPADVEDAAGIAYVHVTAWRETYRGLMPNSVLDTLSIERRTHQWKHTLEDPTDMYHLAIVAEVAGKIVGFANYGSEHEGDPEFKGELFAIYVLKKFQGQGVGRALIREAAKGLLSIQLQSMQVWVLSDNPYRRFYEQLGGVYIRDKSIQIGDRQLLEKAYGWKDVHPLMEMKDSG